MSETTDYKTLDEFYPYYLGEHSNRTCRRLHFAGTSLGLLLFLGAFAALLSGNFLMAVGLFVVANVQGYAWAWTGHFFFEHNKPATFKYPWLSYKGDFRMWYDIVTGKIAF